MKRKYAPPIQHTIYKDGYKDGQKELSKEFFTLFAEAHKSDLSGLMAGAKLSAMAEDWYDANVKGGWPGPRIDRKGTR